MALLAGSCAVAGDGSVTGDGLALALLAASLETLSTDARKRVGASLAPWCGDLERILARCEPELAAAVRDHLLRHPPVKQRRALAETERRLRRGLRA